MSVLLYGCTTWTLTKRLEKKLAWNYMWMASVVLHISWSQHFKKEMLFAHQPPNKIGVAFLYGLLDKDVSVGRQNKIYIFQVWVDIGCNLEELLMVMVERDGSVCVCVSVCVWERENERERRERECVRIYMCEIECAFVCVWKREKVCECEREREREREYVCVCVKE